MNGIQAVAIGLCTVMLLWGWTGHAAEVPPEWKPCEKELAKYCPKAKDSKAMMACIEKREKMGKQKSGLSSACLEAHEKMETPEHEKSESHPR